MTAVLSRSGRNTDAIDVLLLVNAARRRQHLPGLKHNVRLARAAHYRAADMARRHYFAHRGWVAAIKRAGYRWRSVGENIATGQSSAEEVVEDWMASPAHRANILSPKYRELGVARVEDIWVQSFGRR